jgi:hypothetical protein
MALTALAETTAGPVPIMVGLASGLIERLRELGLRSSDMSNARNPLSALAFFAVLGWIVYFARHYGDGNPPESSSTRPIQTDSNESRPEFDGYDCTVDCSGHEAGYRWAEEHSISDGDDCDTAGEHSNSPSFAEGCHAYVDGDSEPENGYDTEKSDGDDHDNDN